MKPCKLTSAMLLVLVSLSLSACDSQEEKQAKYLSRGNQLFEQGQFAKARIEYKNAARIKPSDAEVRYRLGLVDEAENNLRGAFGHFIAAEQQDSKHYLAMKKLSQYFLAAEHYSEVQKRIDILTVALPQDADTHALSAALFLRHKNFEKTEAEARLALTFDPKNIMAYTVLTGLYAAQNDIAKAGATVEEAIKQNPDNLALLLLKAMVYEKDTNLEKITEAYQLIFKLKPTEVQFRDDLAKVYAQAGKKDEAEKVLREGVDKAPDNWNMKLRLVAFLNENRGMEAAEQLIKGYIAQYPQREELYFWLADLYVSNKATDRAVELLQQIVSQTNEETSQKHGLNARTSLARLHFAKGNKETAEKLAQHVLEKDPNNRAALFIRAQMLVEQGAQQEAVSALRTIVRDNPKAEDALQLLAEVLLGQGYLDLAIDTVGQLVDAAPTYIPAKVRLAQLLAARGEADKAIDVLDLVAKIDPSYPVGWESRARIALGIKKDDMAREAISKLEALEGQARTAAFLKGQLSVQQNKVDEAVAHYKSVIQVDPAAPIAEHALSALGDVLSKAGQEEAFATYLSGVPIQTPFVLTLLGESYAKRKQNEQAIASYEKAIQAGAASPNTYLGLARLLNNAKQTDRVVELLGKAVKEFPSDSRAYLMQADVLASRGQYQKAKELYETLLARNPNNDVAANNLAQLIADFMANDTDALEQARQLAERFIRSSNPYYLDTLAWVYFRQGKNEQAQTIFERIMGTEQELPAAAHYHYGAFLFKRGRTDEAKLQLGKAIATDQSYVGLEEAKKMLQNL